VSKGRTIWKIGWRLGVGGALLIWIFHAIFVLEGRRHWELQGASWAALPRLEQWSIAWSRGPIELWTALRHIDPTALFLSLICMGMTILLGVIRWWMVLKIQGLPLSLGRAAEISLVAHFFNSFLWGSTGGDLFKAYYAARETHHKKTEAVVTVLVDRLLGLFAMLLFACVLMLPNWKLLCSDRRLAALAWFILFMMLVCGGGVVVSFWGGVSRRWPNARLWVRKLPKADLLERALDASRQFGKEPFFIARMLGISMILNLFCVFQVMALAWGMNLRIDPMASLIVVPMIVCVSALPMSPGGLGVRENLYVVMLGVSRINVDATAALSVSLLAYAGSLFWSILGGIVYVTRKERDHLSQITDPDSASEDV
jgi:uncharacterized protein (TIRG00374 family)